MASVTESSIKNEISPWRVAMIDLFVGVSQLIGLPKSVGQIYGYLYSAFEPTPMDRIMEDLKISKGSASQGLSMLRQLGAVKTQLIVGERRDHYIAEEKSRKLFSGFLKTKLLPYLEEGEEKIENLEELLNDESEEIKSLTEAKVTKLKRWNSRLKTVLPMLHKLIS